MTEITFTPFLPQRDAALFEKWFFDHEYEAFFRNMVTIPNKEDFLNYPYYIKAVVLMIQEGSEIVGCVLADQFNQRSRVCHAGIIIDKTKHRNNLGYTAYKAWCDYLFNTLNIRKIVAECVEERTLKGAIKCGFKLEGLLKKNCYFNGEYFDETVLALFKE